jgi:hypothetical protein
MVSAAPKSDPPEPKGRSCLAGPPPSGGSLATSPETCRDQQSVGAADAADQGNQPASFQEERSPFPNEGYIFAAHREMIERTVSGKYDRTTGADHEILTITADDLLRHP